MLHRIMLVIAGAGLLTSLAGQRASAQSVDGKAVSLEGGATIFADLETSLDSKKAKPEAALSPQRQLSFLILLNDLVRGNVNIQFIIATHSPLLLAYPGAQIFSF